MQYLPLLALDNKGVSPFMSLVLTSAPLFIKSFTILSFSKIKINEMIKKN